MMVPLSQMMGPLSQSAGRLSFPLDTLLILSHQIRRFLKESSVRAILVVVLRIGEAG
jgi:hypothetical protein